MLQTFENKTPIYNWSFAWFCILWQLFRFSLILFSTTCHTCMVAQRSACTSHGEHVSQSSVYCVYLQLCGDTFGRKSIPTSTQRAFLFGLLSSGDVFMPSWCIFFTFKPTCDLQGMSPLCPSGRSKTVQQSLIVHSKLRSIYIWSKRTLWTSRLKKSS